MKQFYELFLHLSILKMNYTMVRFDVGEGNDTPLQYSCLENPMDGGAWWAAVHGVAKSQTWLSDFTFTFHFHALEKEMTTHCSVLALRIPGMGEPGGLPSKGSHRVRHDWSDLAAAAAAGFDALSRRKLSFKNLKYFYQDTRTLVFLNLYALSLPPLPHTQSVHLLLLLFSLLTIFIFL